MAGRPAQHGGIERKCRMVTIDGARAGEHTRGVFAPGYEADARGR